VFRAWWGLREGLATAPTFASLRARISGATGLWAVWRALRAEAPERLSREEVWVYGCELVRELSQVTLEGSGDLPARAALLAQTIDELRGVLRDLEPHDAGPAWLGAVRRFYAEGSP